MNQRRRRRVAPRAAAGALLLFLALLATLGACSRSSKPAEDPLQPYRAAVKDAFQGDIDLMASAPRYQIEIDVPPPGNMLTGTAHIQLTNTSSDPWQHLVFRLYPALNHYGSQVTLLGALINNSPAPFIYQADDTAVRVDLPQALLPGQPVTVDLSWKLTIPRWSNDASTYALFGTSQEMTSLPLFYPSLAVYEPGIAIGTGHWWLDNGTARGDSAFNLASLFMVTATLPAEQVPVATGTQIATATVSEDLTQHVWVTGPVREFLLHMSPRFQSASMESYGTTVTSYWLPGEESAGRAALAYEVAALRVYSDLFGGYPSRDLAVAPAPLSYRGMEYPQVSLLGLELYSRYRDDLEVLVAHEAAHQWWYQIVHNDPVREPWLDEALAEHSANLYFEEVYGRDRADEMERSRWRVPLALLAESQGEVNLNRPVDAFDNGSQYETVVYAKGALLYARMREALGDRAFRTFLRDYLAEHRYQIVTTQQWLEDLGALGKPELLLLYREWVDAATTPLPTPEPAETPATEVQASQ